MTLADPRTAFARWRELGEGYSPLFSEPLLELVLGHLEPALGPGSRVLDLGSGAGHVAAVFHEAGAHAFALDLNLGLLSDGVRRHPGPDRLAADQATLPIRGQSLDAVFSFSSVHYSDRAAVLAECARVLRPGGLIAVVENLEGNPFARAGRWLRAASGTPYAEHLQPRQLLHWRERSLYQRHFSDVRFEPFHVLTPMLLVSASMASESVAQAGDTGARALYAVLRKWDRALIRRWPAAAWCLVVCGRR